MDRARLDQTRATAALCCSFFYIDCQLDLQLLLCFLSSLSLSQVFFTFLTTPSFVAILYNILYVTLHILISENREKCARAKEETQLASKGHGVGDGDGDG